MTEKIIKVGFLVSYDWYLLRNSIPLVYPHADKIHLALDKKRLTWSGNVFEFDESGFRHMLQEIDTEHKIVVYEDDFYKAELSPMECEVRERNLLASQMGEGGWHLQIDADEYFINFEDFVKFLKNKMHLLAPKQKGINFRCVWIPLFKKSDKGYFYVKYQKTMPESIAIATNRPIYEYGRVNGHFNQITPFVILHDTWAREAAEVWQKIQNWGHKTDFDTEKYFEFWKSIDENNFREVRDFHFIKPKTWEQLGFIEAKNIRELSTHPFLAEFNIPKWKLFLTNNRNIARIKYFFNKAFFPSPGNPG